MSVYPPALSIIKDKKKHRKTYGPGGTKISEGPYIALTLHRNISSGDPNISKYKGGGEGGPNFL